MYFYSISNVEEVMYSEKRTVITKSDLGFPYNEPLDGVERRKTDGYTYLNK